MERLAESDARIRREAYYRELEESGLAPLWERLKGLVPATPRPAARAALWEFAALRRQLMTAGDLLTTEEAERRVLVVENPG